MFLRAAQNRTNYERGQIFPFLLAIIAVIIIMAMITVNLGQMGVFRTDTSNATDAGALSGASVLSGALLGLGLKSDMMCGEMIVALAGVILYASNILTVVAAIAIYIAYLVSEITTYIMALEEGKMAWSNAKKTAIQYAFQNVGVDEPRPTFEDFLKGCLANTAIARYYGISGFSEPSEIPKETIDRLYDVYFKADDPGVANEDLRRTIRNLLESGFSQFMGHPRSGFAQEIGDIRPGRMSDAIVFSRYAWSEDKNSFSSGDTNYTNYDNYVEVQVTGNVMYPLEIWSFGDVMDKGSILDYILARIVVPWWLTWMANPILWIFGLTSWIWDFLLPGGLTMDMQSQTDNNPVIVSVTRGKKEHDLGLWNFRYKGIISPVPGGLPGISATAAGHAFRENGDETIAPVPFAGYDNLTQLILGIIPNLIFDWTDQFDTSKHLFETELMYVR